MISTEILLLGVALAIDAAVVTFAVGLLHLELSIAKSTQRGLIICGAFGLFQGIMLWLGSYAGYLFSFSSFGYYFQIAIAIIFIGLAIKFLLESFSLEEKKIEWGVVPVVILAFATSIDAMAAGISLGTIPRPEFAALEVGLITFMICGCFYFFSHFFRQIPDRWLLRFASVIFVFLAGQTVWAVKHLIFRGY
jgi:putative Mn2+ efflux pump MntP